MPLEDCNLGLIFSALTVNLLAFATGNAYAWSSTVLISLKSNDSHINPLEHAVTSNEESLIASLISFGAAICPFLTGYTSDKFGRKKTLLIFAVPMLVSHLILAYASTPMEFFLARILMGLGVGSCFTVTPIYIGEISETNIRGLLGCLMGVLIALGMLFVYSLGPLMNIKMLSFILMIPIGFFLILFGMFVPESPYFYMRAGKELEAEMSLRRLRKNSSGSILKELAYIKELIEESKGTNSLIDSLKSRSFRKGIIITTFLMVFQQFVGITIIVSYMESIFLATGSSISSYTSTIIVGIIQTIAVILSSFLVDNWGRKIMLIIASIGCALSLAFLGTFFYMKKINMEISHLGWFPIFSLILYMLSYNFGLGTLPWALLGELFATKTKAAASTITAFCCLFLSFSMTTIFPNLEQFLGFHGVFWFFSMNGIFCLFFVLWYVPETKARSFQEILRLLEK